MTYPAMTQGLTTVSTGPNERAIAEPIAQQLQALMQSHLNRETTIWIEAQRCFLPPVVDRQRLSEHQKASLLERVKCAANQPDALMIIDAE